jgi:hypothetical protein
MSLTAAKKGVRVDAAALFPGVSIEYENSPVTPAAGAKWIQIYALDGKPRVNSLGTGGDNRVNTITQVTINYPVGTGAGAADTDYETLQARFPAGSSITQDGQAVTFDNVDMSVGTVGSLWFKVHFSINWYAFIQR